MKCPACKEITTFKSTYRMDSQYTAPLIVDDDHGVVIDYDNETMNNGDQDIELVECDKCNADVAMDEIEIVEVPDEETQPTPNR